VVTYWAPRVPDPLPANLRRSAETVDLGTALLQAHFPDSWEQLKSAQDRLAFDEIFLLQLVAAEHDPGQRIGVVTRHHKDHVAAVLSKNVAVRDRDGTIRLHQQSRHHTPRARLL